MMTLKCNALRASNLGGNPYLAHIVRLGGARVVVNGILERAGEHGAVGVAGDTCRDGCGREHDYDGPVDVVGGVGGDPALVVGGC